MVDPSDGAQSLEGRKITVNVADGSKPVLTARSASSGLPPEADISCAREAAGACSGQPCSRLPTGLSSWCYAVSQLPSEAYP
jgi:hypothetical protein